MTTLPGSATGWRDRAVVDLAVGRERLGRRRRPHRQRELGRVGRSCRTSRRSGTARCRRSSAAAGNRTSTRSFAGTVTSRPAPSVSAALVARTATLTVIGASVWFCTTTGSSNVSPKLRNRGGDGRTISGSRAVIALSPLPNCLLAGGRDRDDAVARQVVGHLDLDARPARRRRSSTVGRERRERVEVGAHRDRAWFASAAAAGRCRLASPRRRESLVPSCRFSASALPSGRSAPAVGGWRGAHRRRRRGAPLDRRARRRRRSSARSARGAVPAVRPRPCRRRACASFT